MLRSRDILKKTLQRA